MTKQELESGANQIRLIIMVSAISMTAISQQASVASDEVAKTISEIAKGASDQARDTETTADNVYNSFVRFYLFA